MNRYNPKDIEPKWQKQWEADKIYQASEDTSKPKKYVLEYFPYPSGAAMHVGHVRNYTIGDAIARFDRMKGYNVLHPMGWDAFGLPAENYAIKNKVSPRVAIDENTARFKEQLIQMGFSYDWSREIDSTDPNYYKWTQWLFLLLHKKGLAYQREALVNWDPVEKTVLANEQVIDGKGERSGALVEKKSLNQWFFKITDYADRLIEDLDDLNWSEAIKSMQRNWIGRSVGAEVDFAIDADLSGQNFLFLHGLGWDENGAFWPWLKKEVEQRGGKATVYSLPNSKHPDIDEQVKFVLDQYSFDANTTVVTHSLGGVVAMKMLPQLDTKINRLVMAAPPLKPEYKDDKPRPVLDDCCDWQFDFKSIQNQAESITVLRETNDHVVPDSHPESIAHELGAELIDGIGQETHFDGKVEPVILDSIVQNIKVFTTRPDTLFGATFMVIAPEHPLVERLTSVEQKEAVNDYVKQAEVKTDIQRQETDREKTGVFTGSYAVNPVNGQEIPVWIADYVLASYGTGAIMAVPAHDERDYAFAKKFDLPVVRVIQNDASDDECTTGEGVMINSGDFDGKYSDVAREEIVKRLADKNLGEEKVNYKIRDWLISRQRYWGAPIPIIHCAKCGTVPVPEDQLPVVLPEVKSYEPPSGDGRSPLANVPEFVNTTCPECGGKAERETDTMDGFACSSWYFLRFADPHNNQQAFSREASDFWLPVDDYIGGAEHAVMHLLYARFWTKVMFDEGLIGFNEPFKTLRNQGMILAPDGQKMSKSKGNTIEPDGLIENGYGADSIRIMELFIGPWNQSANWSVEGMGGSFRFLQRVWTLVQEFNDTDGGNDESDELKRSMHKAIRKVSHDLEELNFNTAIAALMECVNELYKIKADKGYGAIEWQWALETLQQLLAPFAPHIAEELWHQLGQDSSVHTSEWPKYDEQYLKEDKMTIVVQVNGKVRAEISVDTDAQKDFVIEAAKANPKVAGYLDGQTVRKEIYVPGRLVNFVF